MSDEVATVDAAALRRALDDAGRSAEEPLDHLLEEMERPELEPAGEEPIEMAGSAAPELEAADAPHVLRAFDDGGTAGRCGATTRAPQGRQTRPARNRPTASGTTAGVA